MKKDEKHPSDDQDDGQYFTAVIPPLDGDGGIPSEKDAPAEKDASAAEDAPMDEDVPATEDAPVDADASAAEDAPAAGDVAAVEDEPAADDEPIDGDDNTPEAIRAEAEAEKADITKALDAARGKQDEALRDLGAAVFSDMKDDSALAGRYTDAYKAVLDSQKRCADLERSLERAQTKAEMKIGGLQNAQAAMAASIAASDECAAKEQEAEEAARKAAELAAQALEARNLQADASQRAREAAAAAAKTELLTVITPDKLDQAVAQVHAPAQGAAYRICPSCGAEVAADDLFCYGCGNRLPDLISPAPVYAASVPAPDDNRCPNCGSLYVPGDIFCMICGHRLA